MDNQHVQIDSHELAWLAGVIESDGSIYIGLASRNYPHPQPVVTICNTNRLLLERTSNILRCIAIEPYIRELRRQNRPESKPVYQIDVQTQSRCKKLLEAILPYMFSKKAQADLVLEFINSRFSRGVTRGNSIRNSYSKRELSIVRDVRMLNQKGTSQTEDCRLAAAIEAAAA